MDKGIGVQAPHRDSGGQGVTAGGKEIRCGEQENGTGALASGLDGVAHGLMEPLGTGACGGQKGVDGVFHWL